MHFSNGSSTATFRCLFARAQLGIAGRDHGVSWQNQDASTWAAAACDDRPAPSRLSLERECAARLFESCPAHIEMSRKHADAYQCRSYRRVGWAQRGDPRLCPGPGARFCLSRRRNAPNASCVAPGLHSLSEKRTARLAQQCSATLDARWPPVPAPSMASRGGLLGLGSYRIVS